MLCAPSSLSGWIDLGMKDRKDTEEYRRLDAIYDICRIGLQDPLIGVFFSCPKVVE